MNTRPQHSMYEDYSKLSLVKLIRILNCGNAANRGVMTLLDFVQLSVSSLTQIYRDVKK
jgi:hypothetical protein